MFKKIIERFPKSDREKKLEDENIKLKSEIKYLLYEKTPIEISWHEVQLNKDFQNQLKESIIKRIISECFLNYDFPLFARENFDELIYIIKQFNHYLPNPTLSIAVDDRENTVNMAKLVFPEIQIRMNI